MALSAIIGAGASLLSNVIGNNEASKNIDKQIQAQQEENQRTRDYNYMLAQKQNEWNIQQWQRENEYNLPANQMARFKEAGLNPDLIYGQSNLSAQSPMMTSGAPATSADMSSLANKPTFAQAFNQAMQAAESTARVSLANNQSKQVESTTKEIEGRLKWQDALNYAEYQNKYIDFAVKLQGKEFEAELQPFVKQQLSATINEIIERTQTYTETVQKIRAEVGLINEEKELKEWQREVFGEAQIKEIASRCNLNYAEAEKAVALVSQITLQNGAIAFDLKHQEARYYTEKEFNEQNLVNLRKQGLILYNQNENLITQGEILSLAAAKASTIEGSPFLRAVDMTFDYLGKIKFNYSPTKSFTSKYDYGSKFTTINN